MLAILYLMIALLCILQLTQAANIALSLLNQATYCRDVAYRSFDNVIVIGGEDSTYQYKQLIFYYANNTFWKTRTFGPGVNDDMYALSISSINGDIYTAGVTRGSVPGFPASGAFDIYVAKLHANATIAWQVVFGSANDDYGSGASFDPISQTFYVSGYCGAAVKGQAYAGGTEDGLTSALHASNGTFRWTRLFGSTTGDSGDSVAAYNGDGCITGGEYEDSRSYVYAVRYNLNGTIAWVYNGKFFPGFSTSYSMFYKVGYNEGDGLFYGAGYYLGFLDSKTTVSSSQDMFITRFYPQNGSRLAWSLFAGTTNPEDCASFYVDSVTGLIALVGRQYSVSLSMYVLIYINGTKITQQFIAGSWNLQGVGFDPNLRRLWVAGTTNSVGQYGVDSVSFYAPPKPFVSSSSVVIMAATTTKTTSSTTTQSKSSTSQSNTASEGLASSTSSMVIGSLYSTLPSAYSFQFSSSLLKIESNSFLVSTVSVATSFEIQNTAIFSSKRSNSQFILALSSESRTVAASQSALIEVLFTFNALSLQSQIRTTVSIADLQADTNLLAVAQTIVPQIIMIAIVFLLLICAVFVIYYVVRQRSKFQSSQKLSTSRLLELPDTTEISQQSSMLTGFQTGTSQTGTTLMVTQHELSIPQFLVKDPGIDFRIGQLIARGGGGSIMQCQVLDQLKFKNAKGIQLVVKNFELDIQSLSEKRRVAFYQELSMLWMFRDQPQFARIFAFGERPACIVMKYYTLGSLQMYILGKNKLSTSHIYSKTQILTLASQICQGLAFMHSLSFVHCDVKNDNVLLELNGQTGLLEPRITDFGISRLVDVTQAQVSAFVVSEIKGASIAYAAPEVLRRYRTNTTELNIDVWKRGDVFSMSIVMLEILNRHRSWRRRD